MNEVTNKVKGRFLWEGSYPEILELYFVLFCFFSVTTNHTQCVRENKQKQAPLISGVIKWSQIDGKFIYFYNKVFHLLEFPLGYEYIKYSKTNTAKANNKGRTI